MDIFVIRLWHRVGIVRAGSALGVLIVALVAGLVIANRQTQHETSADPVHAADAAALKDSTPSAAPGPSSAAADPQSKAQDAASAAAAQAKAAEDAARRKAEEEASRNKTRSPKPVTTKYPIPASCEVYGGNKKIGCSVLVNAGFGLDQMPCLEKLWQKESGWNPLAHNKSSGAHGIPQALPGNKMAKYGSDWYENPWTQIRWGIEDYIKNRYKTPCAAWAHSQQKGWY